MPISVKAPSVQPKIANTSDVSQLENDKADSDLSVANFIKTSNTSENLALDTNLILDAKEYGVVARLLRGCLDLFGSIIRNRTSIESLQHKDQTILKRNYNSLKLWADGHGVLEGKLDHGLERSKELRDTTLLTLNSLCGVLLNCCRTLNPCSPSEAPGAFLDAQILHDQMKYILSNSGEDISDSDSDSDSESNQSSSKGDEDRRTNFMEQIKAYTACLMDLSTALEFPATDPGFGDEPVLPRLEERSAHEYYADLILSKFPKAGTDLADCLGKVSWDRYKRLQATRQRNEHNEAVIITGGAQSTASKSFKDSGLGATTYAESVISFVSSLSNGQRVQIPPLPAEAKKGERFECSACGDFIIATTNRTW
ncbi:hypothetical protein DM02DRAFT_670041, partial [Periconia macrospinosa]